MSAIAMRTAVWARRLGGPGLVAIVVVGILAGVVMGLAAGTRRTASAPDRRTAAAGGDPDLLLFQPYGHPLTAQVAAFEGVSSVRAATFVTAYPVLPDGTTAGDVNTFAGDDRIGGGRLAAGRFLDPNAPEEFTANPALVDLLDAQLGERFAVVAYDQAQADGNELDRARGGTRLPIEITLVGIIESALDFDDPSPFLMYSPALLDAYPSVGAVATMIEVRGAPEYRPDAFLSAVRALPGGEETYTESSAIVSEDSRRAVGVQSAALAIVTAVAGTLAALVVWQITRRMVGPTLSEQRTLRALGGTTNSFRAEVAVHAALLTLASSPVAVGVCIAVSALFPLGVFRVFEPNPGPYADLTVLGVGLVVVLLLAGTAGALDVGRKASLPVTPLRPLPTPLAAVLRRNRGVAAALGTLLATHNTTGRRDGGIRTVAVAATIVAGMAASGVVGGTLRSVTRQQGRWGADYDLVLGNRFVPAGGDLIGPLRDAPTIAALTAATTASVSVENTDMQIFATETVRGRQLGPVLLVGNPPTELGQIALGREVARNLAVGIGSTLTATSADGSAHTLEVVGLATTPDQAGRGAWMTFDALAAVQPDVSRNLVLIELADGAPSGTEDELSRRIATPRSSFPPPTSVKALERVVPAPFTLALVLALILVLALSYRLVSSLRGRMHDLCVVRALGAGSVQLRAAVHWHATGLGLGALLVGVPLGALAGRWVAAALIDRIGAVPGVTVPVPAFVAGAAGVLVVGNLLALWPAHRAAHAPTVTLSHDVVSEGG